MNKTKNLKSCKSDTNEWMDNAISSRVTFATKNELIIE